MFGAEICPLNPREAGVPLEGDAKLPRVLFKAVR
jgi:hypothetical protein